ncbi:MAG TPA: SGNH/GDSL hydrolase family protein [Candidatus Dorea faecigallinarum]|nr:SGNH/GDSL hydrolase family protein [Candidatus Dorea faecigallinarum]
MKIDRRKQAAIRVVVPAAGILLIVGIILLVVWLMNQKVDTSEGLKRLAKMEETDVIEVDKKIQELEAEERESDEEWANRPPSEKFANAVVLGDSIAQGLSAYEVLNTSQVLAEKGAGVVNGNGDLMRSQVEQAKSLAPQVIFLSYGMNDMMVTDQQSFLDAYRQVLEDLKSSLPDTAIYVNSILPVQQAKAEAEPPYANIPQYNEGLEALCEELEITFIDNTDLVKEEYYSQDGVHMAPEFYTEWVNRMVEVAGL